MSLTQAISTSTGLSYRASHPSNSPILRVVLLIPGLGCPGADFLLLVHALLTTHPSTLFLAPDLPGIGASPASLCPEPTIPALATLLHGLCDELAPSAASGGKRILVSHSLGCRIALELFSQQPADVAQGLVLLDGNWRGPDPPQPLDPAMLPPRDVQVQMILQGLDTAFGPRTPEAFKEEHRQIFRDADLGYLGQMMMSNRRWDAARMVQVLKQVGERAAPLLLVQATDEGGGSRRALKKGEETAWMKLVRENVGSGCRSLVIEDSGHWPHVDQTEQVAEAISGLVAQKE